MTYDECYAFKIKSIKYVRRNYLSLSLILYRIISFLFISFGCIFYTIKINTTNSEMALFRK